MQEVKYSVIIPIYNSENTLRACVESIINQNYSDFELILVNDGSTDSSLKTSLDYAKKYNNVFVIDKVNGGVSSARNAGIKMAKGKYILFVDSDDEIFPGYFLSLDKAGNEDFLVFGYDEINEFGYFKKLSTERFADGARYMTISRDSVAWNKRYKRDILIDNDIDFPEDIDIGEDFVFCLKYALFSDSISFLKESLYLYNNHILGSLTRRPQTAFEYSNQSITMYNHAFQILELPVINNTIKKELICNLDYNYCRTAFACTMIPVIYRSKNMKRDLCDIANLFYSKFNYEVKPKNLIHRIIRFSVRKRLKSVLYAVAVLKNLKDHILLR